MTADPALNIDHVARLARLALSEEEKQHFAHQLQDVLRHIEQLKQVDVSGVEPMAHAFDVANVWAADVAEPGLPVAEALRNALEQRSNMIVVPKVVE